MCCGALFNFTVVTERRRAVVERGTGILGHASDLAPWNCRRGARRDLALAQLDLQIVVGGGRRVERRHVATHGTRAVL